MPSTGLHSAEQCILFILRMMLLQCGYSFLHLTGENIEAGIGWQHALGVPELGGSRGRFMPPRAES